MTRSTTWSIPVSGDKGLSGGELKNDFTVPSSLLSFAPCPSLSLNRKLMFFNIPLYPSFTPSLEPLQWARQSFRSWGCTIPIYPYLCNKQVFNIYSELRTEAPPLPALSIFSQAGPCGKELGTEYLGSFPVFACGSKKGERCLLYANVQLIQYNPAHIARGRQG